MVNNNAQKFREIHAKYQALQRNVPRIVGRLAVNFFKNSFKIQGQKLNGSVKPWKARKDYGPARRKGRFLLVDSGDLRRGIIIQSSSTSKVVIGMDAITKDYATLHNDGGKVTVTAKMRKFFWAMHFESPANSPDANFWRNMALTKKKFITIDARPFIYDSTDLVKTITKDMESRIRKIVNP